jgi:hypothetical protein
MRVVSAAQTFSRSVHEAEAVWYDTTRWPSWVDGLARVIAVDDRWPQLGARVAWESGPAGRGQVIERVMAYESLAGQTVEVQDDSITGRQSVAFGPSDGGVEIELTLEYQIRRRSPLTPLIDVLFIRRAFRTSLEATLHRFGVELEAAREADVG